MNQQVEQTDLKRTMKSRHLFMIALGGVIGTGLFMGSGQIVHNAGPGGAYCIFSRWICYVFNDVMSW